jgi:hypothetical protein
MKLVGELAVRRSFASRQESRPSFARHGPFDSAQGKLARVPVPTQSFPHAVPSPHSQLRELLDFLLQDDG